MNTYPTWPIIKQDKNYFVPAYGEKATARSAASAQHASNKPVKKRTTTLPESQYPSDLYPW